MPCAKLAVKGTPPRTEENLPAIESFTSYALSGTGMFSVTMYAVAKYLS